MYCLYCIACIGPRVTAQEATQQKLADANSVAEEAIASIATVRSFGGENFEQLRFQARKTMVSSHETPCFTIF